MITVALDLQLNCTFHSIKTGIAPSTQSLITKSAEHTYIMMLMSRSGLHFASLTKGFQFARTGVHQEETLEITVIATILTIIILLHMTLRWSLIVVIRSNAIQIL